MSRWAVMTTRRAAGAAQASGHARATTVLVDAPEWATPEDVAVAFPALSDEQIGAFRRFGVERAVGGGEVLYRRQDPHFAMYVVLEGRVAIIDDYGGAQERVLLEYGPGGFVGEYNLLTGQASYMSAVAAEPMRLVEIQRGPLRELMAQEETLGELVLRALTAQIEELIIRIEAAIAPFARQVAQLDEIPGVGATGAQEIIAEIGVDMARFPTPGHLVSWAKFAPTPRQSAGKS